MPFTGRSINPDTVNPYGPRNDVGQKLEEVKRFIANMGFTVQARKAFEAKRKREHGA